MSRGSLRDEASCSLCLQLFQDPVSIHCGHSFCRGCITRRWQGRDSDFSCPRCRQTAPERSLRPNWELAGVVEATKGLAMAGEAGAPETLCQEHQEALKLFCEDEQRLICVVCNASRAHRDHSVVPVDEAAQESRERIRRQLQRLRREREALRSSRKGQEDQAQDQARRTRGERQKIVTQSEELQKLLEHQEAMAVARLEQLDAEATTARKRVLDALSEETTRLDALIEELERLEQRPDGEVLKDIKTTLSGCQREPTPQPPDVSAGLEEKLEALAAETAAEMTLNIRAFVGFHLPPRAQVTLDPGTAHAHLLVADDRRSVRWVTEAREVLSTPERFRSLPCMLGSRGFSSGCHCWEVEATGQGTWAAGVARGSVPRDRSFPMTNNEGVWALYHLTDRYKALTSTEIKALDLLKAPQRLRVVLDFLQRRVQVFEADTKRRIYTFWGASFRGETLSPWFLLEGDVRLQLC